MKRYIFYGTEQAYLERQITGIMIKNLKGTQKISFHLSLSTYPECRFTNSLL